MTVTVVRPAFEVEHAGELRAFRLVEAREAEALLLVVLVQEPQA